MNYIALPEIRNWTSKTPNFSEVRKIHFQNTYFEPRYPWVFISGAVTQTKIVKSNWGRQPSVEITGFMTKLTFYSAQNKIFSWFCKNKVFWVYVWKTILKNYRNQLIHLPIYLKLFFCKCAHILHSSLNIKWKWSIVFFLNCFISHYN